MKRSRNRKVSEPVQALAEKIMQWFAENDTAITIHNLREVMGLQSDQADLFYNSVDFLYRKGKLHRAKADDKKRVYKFWRADSKNILALKPIDPSRPFSKLPGAIAAFDDHPKPIAQVLGSMIVAKNDIRLLIDIALRSTNINASEEELILRMVERSA